VATPPAINAERRGRHAPAVAEPLPSLPAPALAFNAVPAPVLSEHAAP